ncbi:hypothetical protein E2C01_057387 [Portunus trituberculatus]|uniref:Uncharacterized protein n=1 Tax=Portunus trituberculatus TaxID=210409 RepID=A0A5B7GSR7_PORTR|nr:hypothetical protein [Portunus trituberculatus]
MKNSNMVNRRSVRVYRVCQREHYVQHHNKRDQNLSSCEPPFREKVMKRQNFITLMFRSSILHPGCVEMAWQRGQGSKGRAAPLQGRIIIGHGLMKIGQGQANHGVLFSF